MNYFELFEIPIQLRVDKGSIKKKFFELSRRYHPDYFTQANDAEQQQALEVSAQLNKALNTLSNEDETIKYVLQIKGLLIENEKYNLPPPFLMEMMELNEAVADAALEGGAQNEGVRDGIKKIETDIYEPVKQIVENYKEGVTTEEELLQVKDYYFKKKYIQRLQQGLS